MKKYLICNKCGWGHFSLTREEAEQSVKKFNDYFDSLSIEEQNKYYNGEKSSIKHYEQCFRCGESHKNTKVSDGKELPDGVTVQHMIMD